MAVLVIAEHDNHNLAAETLKTVGAVSSLADDIDVVVIGYQCSAVADMAAEIDNIKRVLVADNVAYQHQLAENSAVLVAELAKDYSHIVGPASTFGKNLLPRVAALLDVGMLSDVVAIESDDTVIRPIYAGNALARVRSSDSKKLMTIRGSAFEAAGLGASTPERLELAMNYDNELVEFVDHQVSQSERPELTAARVVVSGGRG